MTGHPYVPDEELRASTDMARWAAEFTSRAWWDPRFALDEENVELWFSCAAMAAATASLEQAGRNLSRVRRGLLVNRLWIFATVALFAADIVLRVIR